MNFIVEGYQGSDLSEVSWLCEGTVCLETLLLESDQWGYPVPAWLPPPATRDCPRHTEETGSTRDQTTSQRCSQSWRSQAWGRQRGLQEDWWQGWSCWTWISSNGVQRRIRPRQASSVEEDCWQHSVSCNILDQNKPINHYKLSYFWMLLISDRRIS